MQALPSSVLQTLFCGWQIKAVDAEAFISVWYALIYGCQISDADADADARGLISVQNANWRWIIDAR